MVKEDEVRVFIDGCVNYFRHVGVEVPEVSAPYLLDGDPDIFDYTGIIGISGARKGNVYFTAEAGILKSILQSVGEESTDPHVMSDMVGEVTNTISGNVRKVYGQNFVISVPAVITSNEGVVRVPAKASAFVVPLSWSNAGRASLIIVLQ
ncbi:MAG: chemotaxis protein CheX [Gammaproteobacteria bacterium]|nr:chemotaxis protein CheX [Gammaproteobacteria bacterium]